MESLLVFVQGPLLRFAVAVLLLGLARHVFLTVWGIIEAVYRTGDRNIPYLKVIATTLGWMFPVTRLHRSRLVFSLASFTFHAGIILSSVFLAEHIVLWRDGLGIGWPALPRFLANLFTVIGIIGLTSILFYRIYVREARSISGLMDYFILVLLWIIMVSGFVAGQPWNPFPYDVIMLAHMVCGIAVFLMFPFTKLAHVALYPLIRLSSEVGWHFTPTGGSDAAKTLYGPEGRKV